MPAAGARGESEVVIVHFCDGGDEILQHPPVGRMVEDVAGGEATNAMAPRHFIEPVDAKRIAGTSALAERAISAAGKDVGKRRHRRGGFAVRQIGHQSGDQPLGPGGDVLPVEEALALLAFLARPALADGEQAGEAGPSARSSGQTARRPSTARLRRALRTSVHQVQPAAGDQTDSVARPARGRDQAGDRISIRDAKRLVAEQGSGGEQLLRAGGAAQEAEMAGDLELGIGHPNTPCRYQLRSPVRPSPPSPRR